MCGVVAGVEQVARNQSLRLAWCLRHTHSRVCVAKFKIAPVVYKYVCVYVCFIRRMYLIKVAKYVNHAW
jgi:hypothetical protein